MKGGLVTETNAIRLHHPQGDTALGIVDLGQQFRQTRKAHRARQDQAGGQ